MSAGNIFMTYAPLKGIHRSNIGYMFNLCNAPLIKANLIMTASTPQTVHDKILMLIYCFINSNYSNNQVLITFIYNNRAPLHDIQHDLSLTNLL